MNPGIHSRILPSPIFLALTILVYALSVLLVYFAIAADHPEISIGITYDLAFTAPFFYYLAIRRTRISRLSICAVALFGIALAAFLLPEGHRGHLRLITNGVLPFLEIATLGIIGYKAFAFVREARKCKRDTADMSEVLHSTAASVLGDSFFARAVAYEMSVLYYALSLPARRRPPDDGFSYHKTRGTTAIYALFAFLVLVETIALHVVISIWSLLAASIVTALSIYFILFILAQYRAGILRPVSVRGGALRIRCGLMCDTEIELSDIETVEDISSGGSASYDHEASFLRGFERNNLLIRLSAEAEARGPYGFRTRFKSLALYIDEKEKFIATVLRHDD